MVYILSNDPARIVMGVRRRQRGSGRRRQRGSGRRRQKGSGRRRQRGSGFREIVKTVASKVIPYAKQAGKYALREGLRRAPQLLASKNKANFIKDALKHTALSGVNQLAREIGTVQVKQGRRPRKRVSTGRTRRFTDHMVR